MRALKWVVALTTPVLLATFSLLSLYAHNQAEVAASLLSRPLTAAVIVALALFSGFFLLTRSTAKASVLSSLVVVAFFDYGIYFDGRTAWFVLSWLAVLAAAVAAVTLTRRDFVNLTYILAAAALFMTGPQAVKIVRYRADHPQVSVSDTRLWATRLAPPKVARGATLPDIYVISPDDYARTDVLKKYFKFDNSAFVDQMERRGFVFSTQNRSPYSYSEMNMAALLNMDYLARWPGLVGRRSEDFELVKSVAEDNRAAQLLTSIGYDYVHLDTDEVTFSGGNPGISAFATPDSFANVWLGKSILRPFGGPFGMSDDAINGRFRTTIRAGFKQLRSLPASHTPKFVVFHTLLPHDPFLFDAGGHAMSFPADADHTGKEGMAYYLRQLEYVNVELLDTIDAILAGSKTPPVIVVTSDEGFEVNEAVFGEAAAADIRVKGISAIHLPGVDERRVPTPPNTVNNLRFVFNRVFGTSYPMLDSVSHIEGDLPFDFREITVS